MASFLADFAEARLSLHAAVRLPSSDQLSSSGVAAGWQQGGSGVGELSESSADSPGGKWGSLPVQSIREALSTSPAASQKILSGEKSKRKPPFCYENELF